MRLLRSRYLQLPQLDQWQEQDEEIRSDVENAPEDEDQTDVRAVPMNGRVPLGGYRNALQDVGKYLARSVGQNEQEGAQKHALEGLSRKEAVE